MALAAYRHVLRSTRIAFQGLASQHTSPRFPLDSGSDIHTHIWILGDVRLLTAARHEARKDFDTNRSLSSSNPEAAAGIAHAEDVARILRQNVVQGEKVSEEGEKYRK
ncbi:Mitochondrial zinc maintenance protein 1, mitochondrial [Hypocenomyce scalaris]|nr:Mitochondrial zinc maintenance protein 1, mitochondrial [Hypocenomyce scalaris]